MISPIGDEGSEVRLRADQVLSYVIKPITEERHSYVTTRADDIPHPGMITPQIIGHLINDDMVIADLTGSNPNVTYELAIRHMVRKHVIQIKDSSDHLPFDISNVRTINFDYRFVKSMEWCREEISKQISAIEANPENVASPITVALNLLALKTSNEPEKAIVSQMQSELQILRAKISELERRPFHPVLIRQDEALSPFSGQVNIGGQIQPISDQSLGNALGNVIFDPLLRPGRLIRSGAPSNENKESKS